LNNLLSYYEKTLQENEKSKLKLVDVVGIKKQLKQKLLKEISGFRTAPNDYRLLNKVNQNDIDRIVRQIKGKLGL